MARSLAHEQEPEEKGLPSRKSGDWSSKGHLNRREYLLLGGTIATAALGVGSGLGEAATGTETFTTDFSEYT